MIKVSIGEEKVSGEFKIIRLEETLKVQDSYTNIEVNVSRDDIVELLPAAPINALQKLANHLYLDFEKPILISKPMELWIEVPFDILVTVSKVPLSYFSTTRIKYTLYGDVVGGTVCRYYKSRVIDEHLTFESGRGSCKVLFEPEEPVVIRRIIMPVNALELYSSPDGKVYYELIRFEYSEGNAYVTLTGKPPLTRLKKIAHVGKRVRFLERQKYYMEWGV